MKESLRGQDFSVLGSIHVEVYSKKNVSSLGKVSASGIQVY